MDAAPPATAGPPGNPHGSDGPTGNARKSGSETRSLWTTSVHGVTLGSGASTASMSEGILGRGTDCPIGNSRRSGSKTRSLRTASVHGVTRGTTKSTVRMLSEILGRGTSRSEENLRGRDRSRLLETASVLGGAFGSCTPSSIGNAWGSDGPSRERASVIEPVLEEPRFPSSSFYSSRGQIRVRSANLLAMLPPPNYHPLEQDMSVTLVAHHLISPRSRMFPLVIPSQIVGHIWFVQIL